MFDMILHFSNYCLLMAGNAN